MSNIAVPVYVYFSIPGKGPGGFAQAVKLRLAVQNSLTSSPVFCNVKLTVKVVQEDETDIVGQAVPLMQGGLGPPEQSIK